MTDPKSELGARFDERRADTEEQDEEETEADEPDDTDNPDNTGNTNDVGVSDNSGDTGYSDDSDYSGDTGDADNTDKTGNMSSTDTESKPGPNRDENATRHRRQVPMYLPDEKADALNGLYERLDGRSKVAGNGGIEKHADFMEEVVNLAVDNEAELADRLGLD
ncbi:hypothetical protein EGH25_10740 [Haladaptatus sp. F3-133]|uniref:Uncharacterized protein n=1 Tax=Halorutilus salinus TaxID=2487751 RepID=A0A9Q4C7R6_9EURY|nr:hypothetical protein [Halorutilus salinus]MCX2819826.1 hypothetical protein [Halorutilus salinus]